MNIRLPPAQQEWLEAKIAAGEFASFEDAVQRMIAEWMAFEADDMAWAKPYVDEARAEVAQGKVMTLKEHQTRMDQLMKSLRR